MRRRLYFVLPNVESARKVHNELLLARIEESHMHVIAKESISLEGLPLANLLQKSDIIHGTQIGFILGGLTGIVLGILAALFPLADTDLGGLAVLATTLAGAFIGAWSSSMIALDVPNTRLKPFQKDIEAGHILFMAEVSVKRVDEITDMIRKHHPEADLLWYRTYDSCLPLKFLISHYKNGAKKAIC